VLKRFDPAWEMELVAVHLIGASDIPAVNHLAFSGKFRML